MFENVVYFESNIERSLIPIILISFTFIFSLLVRINKARYGWYKRKIQPVLHLDLNIVIAVCFVSFFIEISNLSEMGDFREKVSSQEIYTVSGEISELRVEKLTSRTELFKVQGVDFKYNDYVTDSYFFSNRNYKDGVIKEGQFVTISYIIFDREKRIIKVEYKGESK
ncbi:hypothetical protein PSECIP111854_02878 [Pseudoalteromonas sp. CIP111854]|uniref:Uncharacterized protein n=1 Tax=Pseudoalteromonas holothuriae TaxID=2963714 RepID=A0A9W4W161_9GAMM|nr:hypothetical protein [Pseudoalteromonas sp. CIP111854]CAH9061778.1 hypothetical protein PSECIP111854_02878 [Pseudoalteromonas sp. CIP111854]